MEVFFYTLLPDFQKIITFWKVPRLRAFLLLVTATFRWRWIWSVGGMILTGENRSTGRETLYSVGGRWMNGYGALVEWYWQGKTEVLGEKHYLVWVVGEWMGMECWWNGTDRARQKCSRKNLSQCHFVHYNCHMEWPGIEPGFPQEEFGEWAFEIWHGLNC